MPNDTFTKLEAKQAAAILRDVNPVCAGAGFDAGSATILAQPLPFFPGWRLLDIADFTLLPAMRCHVLHKSGTAIVLDGSNASIYRVARDGPIALDVDRAAAYIRFFFQNVRSRGSRFIIAENVDDIPWLAEPPAPLRKEVGHRLAPLAVTRDGNCYQVAATLLSGTTLFAAAIVIDAQGGVTITDQAVLIEELAVRDAVLDA